MPVELIVYVLVAAGLVFWLRSILGTKNGEEREHPHLAEHMKSEEKAVTPERQSLSAEDNIAALAAMPRKNYALDNKTAENGLIDIARADKGFDIDMFLQGAQDAFAMIVESFAEGDRDTLKNLLEPSVYNAFEQEITKREERGEIQITDIHAVRKAVVTKAGLTGKMAHITVKFTAEETSVTRNKDGEIIAGNPDRTHTMNDLWTFSREIRSKDPSWLLLETRGDIEDDNDLIPNSH